MLHSAFPGFSWIFQLIFAEILQFGKLFVILQTHQAYATAIMQ